jgi:hypothetical protein
MLKRSPPNATAMEESQTRGIGELLTTPSNTTPIPPIDTTLVTPIISKYVSSTKSL